MNPQNNLGGKEKSSNLKDKGNLAKQPEILGFDHKPAETKTPEIKTETVIEGGQETSAEGAVGKPPEKSEAPPPPAPVPVAPVAAASLKDEIVKEVENILSEDLTDLFLKMPPQTQEAFRAKGEETASKIRQLLTAAHVNIKKILFLICDWLKMIPGVNIFFLEQEAKIKADKIILAVEEKRKQGKL